MTRLVRALLMAGWLLFQTLPISAWAQGPTTPPPLGAEPLVQECRTRQQNMPWADCACYARKVLELRATRPGGSEVLFQTEAWFACPDQAAIQISQSRKCLDQRRLLVPQGIDATAWCQCRAAEITRLTMAFAPAQHQSHTESDFSNRADTHCRRTVTTPANTLAQGVDLSGPWRFRLANLDLHFDGPPGKWTQAPHESGAEVRHFQHTVTVVGFSEHVAAATARMQQHPQTQALDLQLDVVTPIPYLRARRCQAAEVSSTRVAGRCVDGGQGDAGPFTMRRPEPGETVTTLVPGAAAPPAAQVPPAGAPPAPAPGPTPTAVPPAGPAPAACPSGRNACYAQCASHLQRPGLDLVQRLTQCRDACKAACSQ